MPATIASFNVHEDGLARSNKVQRVTRSQTKKAQQEQAACRKPLSVKVNGTEAQKSKKRRGVVGGSSKRDAKRSRPSTRKSSEHGTAGSAAADAAADLQDFLAQNPDALDDSFSENGLGAQNEVYQPSKAEIFFSTACDDVIERLMAAVPLEHCPKVMLVNPAWAAKLLPRVASLAPTRRILANLMKRQIVVDSSFLQDIMQEGGNSAGLTLRMHMILIDWLVDVAVEFHLGDATLALTSQIIGRFLSVEMVEKRELQLLGVTAMWIASKIEEVVPLVSDFAWITYDTYTPQQLRAMERRVLRALQFKLSCITPWTLVHTVLEVPSLSNNIDMKHVTSFLHDLAIHDPAFSTEAPSEVAAAVVYAALRAVLPAHEATQFENDGVLEYLLQCKRQGTKALLEAIVQLPQKARAMEHKLSAVLVKFRKEEKNTVANRVFLEHSESDDNDTDLS